MISDKTIKHQFKADYEYEDISDLIKEFKEKVRSKVLEIKEKNECDCDDLSDIGALLHKLIYTVDIQNTMIENLYKILARHEGGLG